MTFEQGTSGTLEIKVIRACPVHEECPLDCPERRIEDIGQVAAFTAGPDTRPDRAEREARRQASRDADRRRREPRGA